MHVYAVTKSLAQGAILVLFLGLLAAVASQQLGLATSSSPVGCTLVGIHGDLVAENGRTVLVTTSPAAGRMWLAWPDGWTTRPTDDGQLEVVSDGVVAARTGTRVRLHSVSDTGSLLFRDGLRVVYPEGPGVPDGELGVAP
jgi:hypothetical protein